jgi:hypothetical protein
MPAPDQSLAISALDLAFSASDPASTFLDGQLYLSSFETLVCAHTQKADQSTTSTAISKSCNDIPMKSFTFPCL